MNHETNKPNHVGGEIPIEIRRAQFSRGISGECQNPLCKASVPSSTRGMRLSCSDRCRQIHSILNRAARLLVHMGPSRTWDLLQKLENGGSQGKAKAEVINPEAE